MSTERRKGVVNETKEKDRTHIPRTRGKVRARTVACRERGGGGGSCNPGEIQLLPVPPLRRHPRPSPEANAAASPTAAAAAAAATGLGSDRRPGQASGRWRRRLNRRLVRTHALVLYRDSRVLGVRCGVGTHKRERRNCFLASSWLDLAGAPRRWCTGVCPSSSSCLCVGVGGRRRRAAGAR